MKTSRSLPRGRAWLLGFAVGVAGTLVALEVGVLGLLMYGFMVLMLVSTRSVAPFGGASMATGIWFAFAWWRSLAQCRAINENGGFCEIYDPWVGGVIAAGFLVVGVLLSAYGVLKGWPPRTGGASARQARRAR